MIGPFLKEHFEASGFANAVMNLQVLPLDEVTVVIEYSLQDGKYGDGPGLPWKLRDRYELCSQLMGILLDAAKARLEEWYDEQDRLYGSD